MNRKYDVSTEELIKYRLEGHSTAETARHFNMPKNSVKSRLVHLKIGECVQNFGRIQSPEEKAAEDIKKKNPTLEYAGGYKNSASSINIRCTLCGTEFTKNAVTIRSKGKMECPVCSVAVVKDTLRIDTFMRYWSSEAQKRRKQEATRTCLHPCLICGTETTRPRYCSERCARIAYGRNGGYRLRETKRRIRTKAQLVDKGITLEKLFARDHGVCWICGMPCDYKDIQYTETGAIAGNLYPSVDHIVELCNGGAEAWDNVKLAHRICNSYRFVKDRKKMNGRRRAV